VDAGTQEFRSRDFERARRLIHEIAGIFLNPGKRTMVRNRLTKRLRETGRLLPEGSK
jgi:chemotaxis protein methyltransferase CheR